MLQRVSVKCFSTIKGSYLEAKCFLGKLPFSYTPPCYHDATTDRKFIYERINKLINKVALK